MAKLIKVDPQINVDPGYFRKPLNMLSLRKRAKNDTDWLTNYMVVRGIQSFSQNGPRLALKNLENFELNNKIAQIGRIKNAYSSNVL